MTNSEFNSLIKGELIDNDLYRSYYTGTSIILKSVSIENIIVDDDSIYDLDLHFVDVDFKGSIDIKGGRFKSIVFSGVNFPDNSVVSIRNATIGNLFFRDNSSLSSLNVYGGAFGSVWFFDTILNSVFVTENAKFTSIDFMQATVKKGIMIWSGRFEAFSVAGSHRPGISFISEIYFLDAQIDNLNLSSATSIGRVTIRRGEYKSIIIRSPDLRDFVTGRINSKFEPPLIIDKIQFGGIGKINFTLVDISVDLLKFDKYYSNKESNFNLIGIKLNTLEFNNYINLGDFIFADLSMDEKGKIVISNSDLGKLSFLNSDIEKGEIIFKSSRIINIFLDGTRLPENISGAYSERRSLYSQVKKIYEVKGDIVEANLYYSREMNSYNNTLGWKSDKLEKAIVFLNKWSNNHGQSWGRGVASTLLVSAFLYVIYALLLGFRVDMSAKNDIVINLCSCFFEFINPVHKSDFALDYLHIKPSNVPDIALARLWETLARIPIAYFIYQLIQAFRKHSRK